MNAAIAVESRVSSVASQTGVPLRVHPRPSAPDPRPSFAFTLIELLVVIAIIGALAAMLLAVTGGVKRRQYISNTQAEMAKLITAIENYKAAYGFYPPDNHVLTAPINERFMINPLYYELTGVTNPTPNAPTYYSLKNPALPPLTGGTSGSDIDKLYGLGGFVNCSKPGGEEVRVAKNFLPDLKQNQLATITNTSYANVTNIVIVASVGGPSAVYEPLGPQDVNPWRYNSSSPTNNPGSYDLWIQLVIGRQTNLICNWTKQVEINNPLP